MVQVPVIKELIFMFQGLRPKIQKGVNFLIMRHWNQVEETLCTNFFEASPGIVFKKDEILNKTYKLLYFHCFHTFVEPAFLQHIKKLFKTQLVAFLLEYIP